MRGVRCVRVMYCSPGEQPGGSLVETLEGGIDSEDHWMGHRNMSSRRMDSGSLQSSSGAWRQDKASALFRDPGL